MFYPRNGRTIRIPVRQVNRQLPVTEEKPRPLLADSVSCEEAVAEARESVQAEVENAHKRAERRVEDQIRQEHRRLLTRLLTVADNLERALAHASEGDALYDGVRLTYDDLMGQLAQEGVEPVQALGQPFDPHLHEAVATDGSGGDEVIQVTQTGYTLNGELLRPARVVVGHQ